MRKFLAQNQTKCKYALVLLLLCIPLLDLGPYAQVAVMACIYSILTLSLNLLTGIAGQVSLGHSAFYAVGAYTSALLTLRLGLPVLPAMLIAAAAGALTGAVCFLPARRVSGGYLAIVTLGMGEIVRLTIVNWQSLTRGPMGLPGIPGLTLFGHTLSGAYEYYFFAMPVTLLVLLLMSVIKSSNTGRKLASVRQDPIAAESIGIFPQRLRLFAFTFSGGCAALAGAMYAHFITYIDPGAFTSDLSITVLCMTVLGGMGDLPGSVLSAIVLTILPELLRGLDNVRMLIYGALLVILMLGRTAGGRDGTQGE